MGKKKIIKKSTEELFKEREDIESKMQKGAAAGEAGQLGVQNGFLYISSSYNNTILTLTDELGNVLCWISAGKIGFNGKKKGTHYAANKAAELMAQNIQKFRVDKIHVKVKGIGSGRESAVRALAAHGVNIVSIEDRTPIPHNGCRPPKPRRV